MAKKRQNEPDPEALFRTLHAESAAFREKQAADYRGALNAFLRSLPLATLAEKRIAVRAVNARLASLGLAVRCPKTGVAARLVAHPGNHPDVGRFQIELLDGKRTRTVSTPDAPELDLMPGPPEA